MRRRALIRRAAGIAGATLFAAWLVGCSASNPAPPAGSAPGAPELGRVPTSATVITADDLAAANRPLLDVMRQRLPGMQVLQTQGCPDVVLRGRSTVQTSSSPAIYVDGNKSSNTCILTELRTPDILQVEVYPAGVPPRAGYRAHPYGTILIFIRRS